MVDSDRRKKRGEAWWHVDLRFPGISVAAQATAPGGFCVLVKLFNDCRANQFERAGKKKNQCHMEGRKGNVQMKVEE